MNGAAIKISAALGDHGREAEKSTEKAGSGMQQLTQDMPFEGTPALPLSLGRQEKPLHMYFPWLPQGGALFVLVICNQDSCYNRVLRLSVGTHR